MHTKQNFTHWLFITLLIGCVSAMSANAQTNRMRMPVGGVTLKKPEVLQLKVSRPKALATADKLKLAQTLSGTSSTPPSGFGSSVELTPRNGFVDGQAKLDLADVAGVDYENDYIVIPKAGLGNPVNCSFKPMATGKYLVDLSVRSAYGETPTYDVVAEGQYGQNHMNINETIGDSVGHITFVYEAKDTDWFTVYLHADKQWVFFSCEVTQLK